MERLTMKRRLPREGQFMEVSKSELSQINDVSIEDIYRKLQAYEDIGFIPEEIKELVERNSAKKVDEDECCPICHTYGKDDEGVQGEFCPNCGQRLDWGESDE